VLEIIVAPIAYVKHEKVVGRDVEENIEQNELSGGNYIF